jgi:uncharacterized repeat protein (TIGR03803 family)
MRRCMPDCLVQILLATVALIFVSSGSAFAQEVILHRFVNLAQGAFPGGTMVADTSGNYYGTTTYGGSYGFGVVFELTPKSSGKWQQEVVYNFTGSTDGAQPNSLAIDADGNLFGTTSGGGDGTATFGNGVAFKLSRGAHNAWTETALHVFHNYTDGYNPGGTVLDSAGNVYGTAGGGIFNNNSCLGYCGLIYRLSPSGSGWAETVLYKFRGQHDSGFPRPQLAIDASGNLYGSTEAAPNATVFELSPGSSQWTETTLFSFNDNAAANFVLLDSSGNIYGTSTQGGGSGLVFELVRGSSGQWTESILYTFGGGASGTFPNGITFDRAGNLYGTSVSGGSGCSTCGTVFKLTPSAGSWTETILHNFTGGTDGQLPEGPVLLDSAGDVIGTTYEGTEANVGSVFELAAGTYAETQTYSFPATDGDDILAGLVADSAGNLYGVAAEGGVNQCPDGGGIGCGSIFKLSRLANGTWQRTVLHNFTGTQHGDGDLPYGGLVFDPAGNLYGTTSNSIYGGGTVFELSPTASGGWDFHTIYTFGSYPNDGTNPWGTLVVDTAGNLYGTTIGGGNGGYCATGYCGTVFKLSPGKGNKWTESIIHNFQSSPDGFFPTAGLTIDGAGNLYGTTSEGGLYGGNGLGYGVVFELSPNSNGTWTEGILYSFTGGSDGNGPYGGVILDSSGNLYGTTVWGGPEPACGEGCGVVYELTPAGGGSWNETVIYSFAGYPDGYGPRDTLTFDAAGNLYGTTSGGGTSGTSLCSYSGCGTVFKLTPSASGWNESVLYSFKGPFADGSTPYGGVILDAGGNIYGTTNTGGVNGEYPGSGGIAFEITQ